MPKFEVWVEFQGPIRAFSPMTVRGMRIEPAPTGFVLKKVVDAIQSSAKGPQGALSAELQTALSTSYDVKEWAQTLAEALSLIKRVPVLSILKGAAQLIKPDDGKMYMTSAIAHAEFKPEPMEVPLTEGIFADALAVVDRVSSGSNSGLYQRALSWYARGMRDIDLVDKFIDHWISLETLSNTYLGPVRPLECSNCNKVTNPRPNGAVLRAFLKTVGLERLSETVMKCSAIRGRLFHDASALEEARSNQPILTQVLEYSLNATLTVPSSPSQPAHLP